MIHYFTVPGYGNSGPDHWQTYFEKKIPHCTRIQQQSWEQPELNAWVSAIHTAVQSCDLSKVILIGHSLGCIAISHWAAVYKTEIKGALLVAPPDIEHPYLPFPIESFSPIPKTKIPFRTVIVASTNDQWSTEDRTKEFALDWGSELVFIGAAGHINGASGHQEWEEGLEILRRF